MTTKITVGKENNIKCDPAFLFQRLLLAAQSNPIDMEEILSYELSAFPLSLFETPLLLRKADKPKLAEGIVKEHSSADKSESTLYTTETLTDSNVQNCDKEKQVHGTKTITDSYGDSYHQYVLDGGSLLPRICWTKDKTYGEIAVSCSQFVLRKYDKAIVVFDGYDTGPSTKDITHLRRTNRFSQREVIFTDNTMSSLPKEELFSHPKNKSKFVHLLGEKLIQTGCRVIHSNDDADRDISVTSVEESPTKNVTVIVRTLTC